MGLQLAEIPTENGLGTILTVENRVVPSYGTSGAIPEEKSQASADGTPDASGADEGSNARWGGDWGGDTLSAIPASICDLALQENVRAELKRDPWGWGSRQGADAGAGAGASGCGFLITEFHNPVDALPWESTVLQTAPGPNEEESPLRTSGGGTCFLEEHDLVELDSGQQGQRSSEGDAIPDACNRVMIFGDAGDDQATMFEIKEPEKTGREGEDGKEVEGWEPELVGSEGATRNARRIYEADQSLVDVVQVRENRCWVLVLLLESLPRLSTSYDGRTVEYSMPSRAGTKSG